MPKLRILTTTTLVLLIMACTGPQPDTDSTVIPDKTQPDTTGRPTENKLLKVGSMEDVGLLKKKLRVKAEINPALENSYLRVSQSTLFEKDGKTWITYTLETASGRIVELKDPVFKQLRLTKGKKKAPKTNVIRLWIGIGSIKEQSELLVVTQQDPQSSLTLGSNFAPGLLKLEPGKHHLTSPPKGMQP